MLRNSAFVHNHSSSPSWPALAQGFRRAKKPGRWPPGSTDEARSSPGSDSGNATGPGTHWHARFWPNSGNMANEASSSEKSPCPVVLSHQNLPTYFCLELFWIVFACKQCLICAYFSPDSDETSIALKKAILWIEDLQFIIALMMDLFLRNRQIFASQDINWWTGVVWITYGLLWCFYQLFGLSFWRHPFTAEDPLVSKWCNATFLQIWWRNTLSASWMAWGWVQFQQIKIFGWTIPLSPHAPLNPIMNH